MPYQRGITSTDAHSAGLIDSNDSDDQQSDLIEALRAATLGEYDVYSELGRGGMATVFLALELSLNRSVAIKVMSPAALNHKTLVERFWHEARTAASLSHPNIIPIYAVRAAAGLHFFVMKHVDGGSLDSVLRTQGQLPLQLATTILTQVSAALAYAHRHGVIHRDVKPANIMLDKEGYAIVMDFGIAKVRDMSLTTPGIMVGTPFYMSPEQISGGVLDGRSDQYSLGVVAFELLTGKRPFSGETMPEVLRGHFMDKPPDVRELRPDCPAILATAIDRMLCKDAADRYPSLETVVSILESIPRSSADDAREKIRSLARSISISQPRISQPPSPLPITGIAKRRQHRLAKPPGNDSVTRFTIAIRRRPFLAGGAALMALAAIVAFVTTNDRQTHRVTTAVTNQLRVATPQTPALSPLTTRDDRGSGVPVRIPSDSASRSASQTPRRPNLPSKTQSKNSGPDGRSPSHTAVTTREVASKSSVTSSPAGSDHPASDAAVLSHLSAAFIAPLAVPPASAPSLTPEPAVIKVGSRIPEAGLYVDGSFVSLIGSLRTITHKAGQVRLQIRAEDCIPWDSVLYLGPADTAQIGFRNPKCLR